MKNKIAVQVVCPKEELSLFLLSTTLLSCACIFSDDKKSTVLDDGVFQLLSDEVKIEKALKWIRSRSGRRGMPKSAKKQVDLISFVKDGSAEWTAREIERACDLIDELDSLAKESAALNDEIKKLLPFELYDGEIKTDGTKNTDILFGKLPLSVDIDALMLTVGQYSAHLQPISIDNEWHYVRVLVHKCDKAGLLGLLEGYKFRAVDLNLGCGAPRRLLSDARKRLIYIEGIVLRNTELLDAITDRAEEIKIYSDLADTVNSIRGAGAFVEETKYCAAVTFILPTQAGERFSAIAEGCGCTVTRIPIPFGDPKSAEDKLNLLKPTEKYCKCSTLEL